MAMDKEHDTVCLGCTLYNCDQCIYANPYLYTNKDQTPNAMGKKQRQEEKEIAQKKQELFRSFIEGFFKT